MTLAERLQSTGISLDEKVVFIVEECDHFGQWQAITTGVGRLCLEIPQTVRNLEAMRDFDPHCQVALLVETDIAVSLYVFTPGDDALLCTLEGGGAMIDDDDRRLILGQGEDFLQSVGSTQSEIVRLSH